MEESKRQKQVAQLIASELSTVFMREQINIIEGGMVSISKVQITPDLLEARIYLSFYNIQDNVFNHKPEYYELKRLIIYENEIE